MQITKHEARALDGNESEKVLTVEMTYDEHDELCRCVKLAMDMLWYQTAHADLYADAAKSAALEKSYESTKKLLAELQG